MCWGAVPFHIRRKRWGIPHTPIYPVLFGCRLPWLESSRRCIGFVDCKSRSSRREVEVSVDQYDLEYPLPIHIHHALCTHSALRRINMFKHSRKETATRYLIATEPNHKKEAENTKKYICQYGVHPPFLLISFLKISKIYAEESPLIQ